MGEILWSGDKDGEGVVLIVDGTGDASVAFIVEIPS